MDTRNGAQGQSGFTGQKMANNTVRTQPSFIPQQAANVNGIHPATPTHNNNFHPTMPMTRGAMPIQQAPPQGQPRFASQQLVHRNGNGNGMNHTMSIPNRQGTPAHFAPGNAQLVQNTPRSSPGLVGQQMISNGGDLAMALASDPNAMAGFSQLCDAFLRQRVQNQTHQIQQNLQNRPILQNDQSHQIQQYPSQNHQSYQHAGEFSVASSPHSSRVSSGENSHIFDSPQSSIDHSNLPTNQSVAGTPSDAGVVEPVQPAIGTESADQFQGRVNRLVKEKGSTFGGYIKSDAERARFENAIWTAKWKGGKLEDKSGDYPDDEAERSMLSKRLFDAFLNTEGEQDKVTDADENDNCLAVRSIQKLSPLEIELLTRKLMVSTARQPELTSTSTKLIAIIGCDGQNPARRSCAPSPFQSRAGRQFHG